jgi:hypothetical protein
MWGILRRHISASLHFAIVLLFLPILKRVRSIFFSIERLGGPPGAMKYHSMRSVQALADSGPSSPLKLGGSGNLHQLSAAAAAAMLSAGDDGGDDGGDSDGSGGGSS